MKYVSIDIETTGLNPEEDQVLEIGAIIEDTSNPTTYEDAHKFNVIVEHDSYKGSAYAINMNSRIFDILAKMPSDKNKAKQYKADNCIVKEKDVAYHFHKWLIKCGMTDNESFPLNLAGKNLGTFDLHFLKKLPGWKRMIQSRQRIIDPAILFVDWNNDTVLPNLSKCKQRACLSEHVTHHALDDAWDVIELLRTKYT